MTQPKILEKIVINFWSIFSLIIIVVGLFIFIKELIIGIPFGEAPTYNLLLGATLFFGGLCLGTREIVKEQDIEIDKLKEQLKNETN